MQLTREEAIRLHREMWSYIAERESEKENIFINGVSRYLLKLNFLELKNIDPSEVYNDCFLCEYAFNKCIEIKGKSYHRSYCKYCPLDWKSEDESYPCESNTTSGKINWQTSPAEVIVNLLERDSSSYDEL